MIREGHFKLFGTNPFEPSLDETDRVAAAIEAKLDKNKEARDAAAAQEAAEKEAKLKREHAIAEYHAKQELVKQQIKDEPAQSEFELEGGSQTQKQEEPKSAEEKKLIAAEFDMAAEFLNAVPLPGMNAKQEKLAND